MAVARQGLKTFLSRTKRVQKSMGFAGWCWLAGGTWEGLRGVVAASCPAVLSPSAASGTAAFRSFAELAAVSRRAGGRECRHHHGLISDNAVTATRSAHRPLPL